MRELLHIPVLRHGRVYESLDSEVLKSHEGDALANVSLANPGLIEWDSGLVSTSAEILRGLKTRDVLSIFDDAAKRFLQSDLPFVPGGPKQSPEDYISMVSTTTGLPEVFCRRHMQRLHEAMKHLEESLHGLSRGLGPEDLDSGIAEVGGFSMRHVHKGDCLAVVLPSNAPAVNALWFPALAFRTPIALRPGHADPWTPLRLIAALIESGMPKEAFSFYPSGHSGAHALVRSRAAAMVFGGADTIGLYAGRASVELHGTGQSKIIFGSSEPELWKDHLDLIDQSVLYNGGRSCINASTIVVTEGAADLAETLAKRWASIKPEALDSEDASLAGFVDHGLASAINVSLEEDLRVSGARDVSSEQRGGSRLIQSHGLSFLLPTVIAGGDINHPIAQKERPFPLVSIVEIPEHEIPQWLSYSLALTVIGGTPVLIDELAHSPRIANLHLGALPTTHKDWGQPHEGNLFELLMRRSAWVAGS
jgi:hypothetical protein